MAVKIPANIAENLLRGPYHDLCVAQSGEGACSENGGGYGHVSQKKRDISVFRHLIDNRLDHIGSQKVGGGAYRGENAYQDQKEPVSAEIGEQFSKSLPEIFRPFSVKCFCHGVRLLSLRFLH